MTNIANSNPSPTPPNPLKSDLGAQGASQAGGLGGVTQAEVALSQQDQINNLQVLYPGLSVKGILGGLPVAEKNQEYFVVFDEAGDTSPEIPNQTQFKIIYIVDSKLNVGKPAHDTVALSNIKQNFEPQKYATVRADQGTALNPQLVGTYPITAIGSITPIIGTQVGKGPLQYVTTMSFQLNSQVGLPGGLTPAPFTIKREKTWGRNNSFFTSASSGTYGYRNDDYTIDTATFTLSNPDINAPELEMGSTGSYRLYYDISSSAEDGGAVSASFSGSIPTYFEQDTPYSYQNEIYFLTSSLEGNTRVKIGVSTAVTISTSSIFDLFRSRQEYFYNPDQDINIPIVLRTKIYAENLEGQKSLVSTGTGTLNGYNSSLIGATQFDIEQFGGGTITANIEDDFSWTPTYVDEETGETKRPITWVGTTSGFIDVASGSKVYAEISIDSPEEVGPDWPWIPGVTQYSQSVENGYGSYLYTTQSFIDTLNSWEATALVREYEVLWSKLTITPEYVSNYFIDGVTGLTASYQDTNGSSSLYNYTASYWSGFTNTTNSLATQNICYLTASSKLANFYGGEYTQIMPGTEVYNNYNLETLPSSSLIITTDNGKSFKKTWVNAGFNPLRVPFILQRGDYIRFEYSPDKTYQILNVFSSANRLLLTLDRHIDSSTVIDNFVIYRIIDDGQYIILDVEKDIEAGVNQAFRGIILPQYPSEGTKAKQDELIFELKKAGILQDGANNNISSL